MAKVTEIGIVGLFGWQHPNGHVLRLWKGFRVTKKGAEEIVNGADCQGTAELLLRRRFPEMQIKTVNVPWKDEKPAFGINDLLKRRAA